MYHRTSYAKTKFLGLQRLIVPDQSSLQWMGHRTDNAELMFLDAKQSVHQTFRTPNGRMSLPNIGMV
jgi:hypothetical protein